MAQATKERAQLPIFDLTKSDAEIADAVTDAAINWGFLYIRSAGLGIDNSYLDRQWELARKFFKGDFEDKAASSVGLPVCPDGAGWSRPGTEVLDPEVQKQADYKEGFTLNEFTGGKAQQRIPDSLKGNEEEIIDFQASCRKLCIRLLELFAIGLKIPESEGGKDWFASRHNPENGTSGSNLRYCYYPTFEDSQATAFDPEKIRASSHTDFGSLTILFQQPNRPGLEVLTPENVWSPVAVSPPGTENDPFPPIVVNIADLLSYWTEGVLKSTIHRVNIPPHRTEDRYSIAYFSHPVGTTELVAVPSPLVKERVAQGLGVNRANTAKEHVVSRLDSTFSAKPLAKKVAAA